MVCISGFKILPLRHGQRPLSSPTLFFDGIMKADFFFFGNLDRLDCPPLFPVSFFSPPYTSASLRSSPLLSALGRHAPIPRAEKQGALPHCQP